MAAIQRPSSGMDPLQRSYSRRSLLPAEQQIIDVLGLTNDEYWEFCRLADCKAKERGREYLSIPEILATGEPTTTAYLVNIAIGLVFTAASVLLAPKPQAPEQAPEAIRTADVRGQTRFAELFSFDSVQDLATLGSIIPLIFTKREQLPGGSEIVGGVRAKGLLLWSQLLSLGSHQELKMLTTLGLSELAAIPDAQGLAIGDQLLRNYQEARYRAYFLNNSASGGRINQVNSMAGELPAQIDGDVFLAFDQLKNNFRPLLSGTRTPSSQRVFGCHSPISNGAPYFLPYDIVQVFDGDETLKNKRDKINGLTLGLNVRPYAGRQGMERLNNVVVTGTNQINVGDTLIFRNSFAREFPAAFPPHGLDDVNTAIDSRISNTDTLVNVGDLFAFGSSIIQCTKRPEKPYENTEREDRQYEFICKEQGFGYFQSADADPITTANAPFGQHLQRIDISTITNNRVCDQTEIGIKSVVFKRIDGFANVNSEPPLGILQEYEKDKQAFSLGRITTFQTRYSFFKIEFRKVGVGNDTPFIDISAGQIFAIRGSNPQPQYNTIRVNHDPGQYEFRIVPVTGSTADGLYIDIDGQANNVYLLNGNSNLGMPPISAANGAIRVSCTGAPVKITDLDASNDEFFFTRAEADVEQAGQVKALDNYTVGELPEEAQWKLVEGPFEVRNTATKQLIYGVYVNVDNPTAPGAVFARWNGEPVELGSQYQYRESDLVATIPAVQKFEPVVTADLVFSGDPVSGHHYVETHPNGSLKGAVFGTDNSGNVTALTQDPTLADDFTKTYRVVPDSPRTKVDDNARVTSETAFIRFLSPSQNYFGVWVRRVDGIKTALWDGNVVPLSVSGSEVYIDNVAYVQGTNSEFDANINCDVFEIVRKVQEPAGTARYFQPIQKVQAVQDVQALKLYKIGRYEFDQDAAPFVSGGSPTDYSHQSYSGSGSGFKVNASSFAAGQWQWVISDSGTGYKEGEVLRFQFADSTLINVRITQVDSIFIKGEVRRPLNLKDAIADYPKFDLEKTSHQDGPEHEVVFVNELIRPEEDKADFGAAQYNDLSLLGLRVLAGRDWSSMGQLSAYIKEGIKVERLIDNSGNSTTSLTESTNNFAEIAFNLLASNRLGAGKRIPRETIDRDAMTIAAKFCRANGFRFDGVVGDRVGLREFIHVNAAFNLLDFSIVGGKFSLTPSVPFNPATFVIESAQDITKSVKALFTDGNMKDMQVSFLPTQERQLFKATVAYRQEEENGFSSQRVTQMRFKDVDGGSDGDPEEFIDLTTFCTSSKHAKRIAEYKLLLRKHSEHNIQFKTTPSSALSIAPGDYIKVISNASHTTRFNNGSVDQFGGVTSTTALADGTYTVFFWRPGLTEVQEGQLQVAGSKTGDEVFFSSIFTIKMQNQQKRIYRVTSLTIDDDGFVDIGGSYQKVDQAGRLAILNPDNLSFEVSD